MSKSLNIPRITTGDYNVQKVFEDWVLESTVDLKQNVATYFIYNKKRGKMYSLLKRIGFNIKDGNIILHVVTDRPGFLIGRAGTRINKYKEIFTNMGIDEVFISEVKEQYQISRGIKRKIQDSHREIPLTSTISNIIKSKK